MLECPEARSDTGWRNSASPDPPDGRTQADVGEANLSARGALDERNTRRGPPQSMQLGSAGTFSPLVHLWNIPKST